MTGRRLGFYVVRMLIDRSISSLGVVALALAGACGDDSAPAADAGTGATSTGTGAGTADESGGPPPAEPLSGVADLHLHMFAEHAFGGGWFHGTHDGEGAAALAPCDGGTPGDHGRLRDDLAPLLGTCEDMSLDELGQLVPLVGTLASGGPLVSEFISIIPGTDGDTGRHLDRTSGWPDLASWPRWDAIAHQQMWEGQLREAHEQGLRVAVISAVSLDWLCLAIPEENLDRPQCNEMDDIVVQLQAANAFAEANDWAEVALTAADMRRIVSEDKLAFILSVETSHIMQDGDWRPQFEELYELGVRTLQPVHQLDNRFGGAAPHNPIFQIAQYVESCHIDEDCGLTTDSITLGFDVDAECKNVRGLTDEGRELVQEMIDRGMLVDAAHLSEASLNDLYEIAVDNEYAPIYLSHAHFREIMLEEKSGEEKTTPAWAVEMVRQTGGMIGLRTAPEEVNTYEPSAVANSCHGSSRSFAQAYDYGRLGLKVSIGLGSDLNGFIQQTRPRFGPDACSAGFEQEVLCQARDQRVDGPPRLGSGFDEAGLGHAGLLDDLLTDLDQLGTDTDPLRTSADDFVRMWERAEADRSGPAPTEGEPDPSGIVAPAPLTDRLDEYPSECGERYCPGALLSGADCRFDDECESGTCEGAGECGSPTGTCT